MCPSGNIGNISHIFAPEAHSAEQSVTAASAKKAELSSNSDHIKQSATETGLLPTPEEHAAAAKIQQQFRKSRVNDKMIANGEMYQRSKQELRVYRNGEANVTIKDRVADPASKSAKHVSDSITHTNFMNIMEDIPITDKRKVARLAEPERQFIDNAVRSDLHATHFTKAPIVNDEGRLQILSRQELIRQKIIFPKVNSTADDIRHLGNDGNVFLAIEPGHEPQKLESRFGDKVVRLPLSDPQFKNATALTHDPLINGPDVEHLESRLGRLSYSDSQRFFPKESFPSYFARPKQEVTDAFERRNAIQQKYVDTEKRFQQLPDGPEKTKLSGDLDTYRTQLRWADREAARRQDLETLQDRDLAARPSWEWKEVDPLDVDQSYGLLKAQQLPGALAMKIVADSRQLTHDGRQALLAPRTPEDLNILYNTLYRPQVQQPHSVNAEPGSFALYDNQKLDELRAQRANS